MTDPAGTNPDSAGRADPTGSSPATDSITTDSASAAPNFSARLWQRIGPIRAAIDALPFLARLEDGSLGRERFDYYLGQDARYLFSYGKALAAAASQADTSDDVLFWATAARTTFVVERQLHAAHVQELDGVEASPTCLAYTTYLQALAGDGSYPVLAAGILPCFWIYQDVGDRMLRRIGNRLSGHPYQDWISTYADPEFAQATADAIGIVDRLAGEAGDQIRDRMGHAFVTASRYEWMFWDAAHRMERWPV